MSYLDRAKWLTDKFILSMLWFFPLFTGFQGYDAITEAKQGFFTIATCLWLAGVLLMLLIALLRGEKLGLRLRPAHYALTAFLLIAAFSALLSPRWELTLLGTRYDGLVTLVLYGGIFWGVSLLGEPKRKYIWAMAGAVTLCNILCVIQLLGRNPLSFYPDGTNYYDKFQAYNSSFLGTIGNTGLLGQYLCIVTPVIGVYGLKSKNPLEKGLLLACAAFCLVITAFSLAEAAYMGVLALVLIGVPVMLPKKKQRRRAAMAAAALVLAGLIVVYFWPGDSGTVWELSRILHGDVQDSFGSSRVQIWRRCLELFRERPWLGGGIGTFAERAGITWSRYVEAIGDYRYASVTNAHNAYLGYLTDTGLLGLLAYVTLIVCSMQSWLRRRFDGAYYGALGCSLLCALVQDFFCLNLCLVTPMMWVLWGLLESPEPTAAEQPETES